MTPTSVDVLLGLALSVALVHTLIGAWAVGDVVVAEQDSEGLATWGSELVAVDLPEELALIELDGALRILDEV